MGAWRGSRLSAHPWRLSAEVTTAKSLPCNEWNRPFSVSSGEFPLRRMNHLTIPILEFVKAQPAHRLPVVFTAENSPLPDCSESPEEILKEVLTLQKDGWIEAHVIRDVTGKPYRAEVRYISLAGSVFLDGRASKARENAPIGKLILWGIVGIVILLAIILGGFAARNAGSHSQQQHESPKKEMIAETLPPTPSPTPVPVATPEAPPSPAITPAPSATPTPAPVASPTFSSKLEDIVPKQRSFKKTW